MFRITQIVSRSGTTINIEGQLTKEYAQFAEDYCSQLLAAGKRLYVNLHDILTVDEAGRKFLCHLAAGGVRLQGKGVYMTHLLSQIRRMAKDNGSLQSGTC